MAGDTFWPPNIDNAELKDFDRINGTVSERIKKTKQIRHCDLTGIIGRVVIDDGGSFYNYLFYFT
jgi:hypothetical protein